MDYKYGLSALPQDLREKLSTIPSYKKFGKEDWTEELLEDLFKDLREELTSEEQTTFYKALLQSVSVTAKNGFEEVVNVMKPAIDSGLTQHAKEAFKPGSKASIEMAKLGIESARVTLLLCNIFEAQEANGDDTVDELMDTILDLAELGHEKDIFKRIEVVYNGCKKISESPELYRKPPPNKGNKFTP